MSQLGLVQPKDALAKPNRSLMVRLKQRLQFTGWLQYGIHTVATLMVCLVAGLGWLIGAWPLFLFWLPLGVAALLLVLLVFDLVTVKFGFRPTEALPSRRDGLDAFDLMRTRRSCRSFQSRKLTPEHHAELMDCVRAHTQPGSMLGSHPIRFEYIAAPLTVWPVVGAHEFLVAIAPAPYNRLAVFDVGRCLQKVVLQATRMGLATCWIGPGADQRSTAQHLAGRFNPETDHVVCVCAVGYASKFKPTFVRFMRMIQHRRLPLESLFFSDPHFKVPLDVTAPASRSFGRCYEACQWSPSSFNGQTTRCAAVTQRANGTDKLVRFDFCAATTSRYYAAVALGIWCADWETGCQALRKPGHFAVLTPEQRGVHDAPLLPRYDVSWMVDSVEVT